MSPVEREREDDGHRSDDAGDDVSGTEPATIGDDWREDGQPIGGLDRSPRVLERLVPAFVRPGSGLGIYLTLALVGLLVVAAGVVGFLRIRAGIGPQGATGVAAARWIGLVVGTVLVGLVALGLVLHYWIVSPLARLRDRACAIETGRLDTALSATRTGLVGDLFRAVATLRDALERQMEVATEARERARRAEQELQRQNDRLDRLTSSVSHDLRNPLTAAMGHVEIVASQLEEVASGNAVVSGEVAGSAEADETSDTVGEVAPIDVEQLLSMLETVETAHRRIDAIVEDVLVLTRGADEVEQGSNVDLATVARGAWDGVDQRNARLDVRDTATFSADEDRLRRVFEHLLRNAVEHGGPDVEITVGATASGFYVADDGAGIPNEHAEDVFEFGFTTHEGGTGLGLAVVEAIADAHGWTVTVDATAGPGTRLVVSDVDVLE